MVTTPHGHHHESGMGEGKQCRRDVWYGFAGLAGLAGLDGLAGLAGLAGLDGLDGPPILPPPPLPRWLIDG